jgi:TDG/mug DNA glycosylase family protein
LRTLPDTVGPGMRMLVCGLNPSVVAADAGFGFAGATNRFWPAATQAGLLSRTRDPLHALLVDGVGMTDLVKRATPGTKDLEAEEYRAGAQRVQRLVRWLRPRVVLFVGLEGWRAAVDRGAHPGLQRAAFGEAPAYVMPSTSGLNAHARLADLVAHLRAAAEG